MHTYRCTYCPKKFSANWRARPVCGHSVERIKGTSLLTRMKRIMDDPKPREAVAASRHREPLPLTGANRLSHIMRHPAGDNVLDLEAYRLHHRLG